MNNFNLLYKQEKSSNSTRSDPDVVHSEYGDHSGSNPVKSGGHLDMSVGSPVMSIPFNAYGTMQSLLTSHMKKVSASQFDDSVEMRSPLKRQIGDRWEEGSRPEEVSRSDYREMKEDPGKERRLDMDTGYR